MENILEIKNLSKKYDGFELKNINIELPKGMIMGFIGENGAGNHRRSLSADARGKLHPGRGPVVRRRHEPGRTRGLSAGLDRTPGTQLETSSATAERANCSSRGGTPGTSPALGTDEAYRPHDGCDAPQRSPRACRLSCDLRETGNRAGLAGARPSAAGAHGRGARGGTGHRRRHRPCRGPDPASAPPLRTGK